MDQLEFELQTKRRECDKLAAENAMLQQERYRSHDQLSRLTFENQDLLRHLDLIKNEYEEYKNKV